MRAGLRWTTAWLCGALAFAAPVLAQSATDVQPAASPPSDAVGPTELQNFSLKGSVTKPADQAPPAPAPQPTTRPATKSISSTATAKVERRSAEARQAASRGVPTTSTVVAKVTQAPGSGASLALPRPTTAAPAPSFTQPAAAAPLPAAPATPLEPGRQFPILRWIAAALALAGGIAFFLWRRRPREAFAGPEFDLFVPPEPAPLPAPAPLPRAAIPQPSPVPPKPVAPANKGIVSTRLRPQIEIAVQPLRCTVDGEQVVLDFELELFNAGAAPARAVQAETALFNAGATQDQQLSAFFTSPAGAGERLELIPPMKRVTFASQVVAPRSAIQEYELAGRKTIVPVLAFNALYEWSGGKAQTSAAFLVGRETNNDKLGPLTLNGAAREFHGLGVRALRSELRD